MGNIRSVKVEVGEYCNSLCKKEKLHSHAYWLVTSWSIMLYISFVSQGKIVSTIFFPRKDGGGGLVHLKFTCTNKSYQFLCIFSLTSFVLIIWFITSMSTLSSAVHLFVSLYSSQVDIAILFLPLSHTSTFSIGHASLSTHIVFSYLHFCVYLYMLWQASSVLVP